MRIYLIIMLWFMFFQTSAQRCGEVWFQPNHLPPGIMETETLYARITIIRSSVHPGNESVWIQDLNSIDTILNHKQIKGFVLTDHYNRPEYQYLPVQPIKHRQPQLYQVLEKGSKIWLLEWDEKHYFYHTQMDQINPINNQKDLFNNLDGQQHIKQIMKTERWHWHSDIKKIVQYYNEVN